MEIGFLIDCCLKSFLNATLYSLLFSDTLLAPKPFCEQVWTSSVVFLGKETSKGAAHIVNLAHHSIEPVIKIGT